MLRKIFALVCCLASLIAMAAFAGFLLNWLPKSIDTGLPPVAGGVALNVALLAAFGIVHSAMARPAVKRFLYGHYGPACDTVGPGPSCRRPDHDAAEPATGGGWPHGVAGSTVERPVYVAVSALQLAALMWWWTPMPQVLWHAESAAGAALAYGLFVLALLLVAWAVLSIDALHFFGLRQQEPPFALKGPYRFVRHPIQTGLILALWATPHMTVGHALMAALLSAYSVAATLGLEERDLERALGDRYRDYRARVPALLPGRRRR